MASKRFLLLITALLLVFASTCAMAKRDNGRYDDDQRRAEVTLSGLVTDIDYGSEVFAIRDGNTKYTVIAEDTRFVLRNGTAGYLRDVRKGMTVRIDGERITSSQFSARTVTITNDQSWFDNGRYPGNYNSDRDSIQGYVTEVNTRAHQIHVRANRDNYVVDIDAGTEIRRSGFLTGINGIKKDDQVSVSGNSRGRGRIDAAYIQIITNDRDNRNDDWNNRRTGTVEGTVSSAASYFDRSIAIHTTRGDIKVDVAKDADVRYDGRGVSIHDISKGAWVRAYGDWQGSTFTADRIDAYSGGNGRDYPDRGNWPHDSRDNPSSYYQTRVGTITSIDTRKNIIKLDVGVVDMTVNATNAEVTNQGSRINLSRLQKGDKIQVSGEYSADTLRAHSIQVLKWAEDMTSNDRL